MPVTKYSTKGSALTTAEMDANWDELQGLLTRLGTFQASQTPGANNITVTNASGVLTLRGTVDDVPALVVTGANTSGGKLSIGGATISGGAYYPSLSFNTGNAGGAIIFYLNGVEAGRFGNNGSLQVGVTGASTNIFYRAAANDFVLRLVNSASSAVNPYGLLVSFEGATNGAGSAFIQCNDLGGARFIVYGSGDVRNVNNSYGAISDLKLKENIETARDYLQDLCRVRVVRYSLKSQSSTTPTHLGIIAQELEQVFPGMVDSTNDTAERQATDETGKLLYEQMKSEVLGPDGQPVMVDDPNRPIMELYETGEVTKGVKYSVFVPMLITAIQELKARNDALEARIAALEGSSLP